jgi:hypothetical protein
LRGLVYRVQFSVYREIALIAAFEAREKFSPTAAQ